MLCACKFMEDDIFTNTYYAKIIGITLDEINKLEEIFLSYIKYELYIRYDIYKKYEDLLKII